MKGDFEEGERADLPKERWSDLSFLQHELEKWDRSSFEEEADVSGSIKSLNSCAGIAPAMNWHDCQFHVMGEDPDDNAFTDCAIAAYADFVISEDHHFNLLANAGYKPQPITPSAFIHRYRGLYF